VKRLLPFALIAFFLSSDLALSQVFEGRASVIDADTLEVHGTRIRLNGIDAPETNQTCLDSSHKEYRCGQHAALELDKHLQKNQPIECIQNSIDRYGRVVATCYTPDGQDIAAWLVLNGLALDWPLYSKGKYETSQENAIKNAVGIWQGDFIPPWEWRKLPKKQKRASYLIQ
jgi:endonuclease YncB( thermonuclease family)